MVVTARPLQRRPWSTLREYACPLQEGRPSGDTVAERGAAAVGQRQDQISP